MYSKYRAKDIKTNKWVYGSLLNINNKNYILPENSKTVQFDDNKNTLIINESNSICINNDAIDVMIGYTDSDKHDIYSGDIVQFGNLCTVLVWFCKEMNCLTAVDITDVSKVWYNGTDYHSDKSLEFTDFCFMLQDPYGDMINKIHIIGNIYDNPELVENIEHLY